MASRSSRYRPEHDDPYISKDAYPDPYGGVHDDAYEYVGPDAIPDPPPHTFDDEPGSPRRPRSPSRQHRSRRAATLPPKTNLESPSRSRRHDSPPRRSSRNSDSPPRRQRSRRDTSPPTKLSNTEPAAAVPATGRFKDKYGRWVNGPAVKNMKTYGKKGLNTMGSIVEAYAAAQAVGASGGRGRPAGRPYDDPYYDDYYDDPYDRPSRRSRRRYSPSVSRSPPRRSATRRSDRPRPPLNGRHKSYSMSPTRGRGYDSDEDRRHSRRTRRRSPSYSPSPEPRSRRRARSQSHGRESRAPSVRSKSGHPHMRHYKTEMKSPNPDVAHRWQLAARAALEAGGVTAFRLRKEPGSWTGQKGAKVVTAALGAAAIDSFIDKDPRRAKGGGMKGMAESVVGGLLASKIMGFKSATTHKGEPRRW